MSTDLRDERGRFAPAILVGLAGPRRTIERKYMATLREAVLLDDWRNWHGS